ncbi:MAG TPA: NUDIX hydrolase [Microvirga sp.]
MNRELLITRVAAIDAVAAPWTWPWAEASRAAIDANWAEKLARVPQMFDGRVLLLREVEIDGGKCRATYFETGFKAFLGWRDLGYPDPTIGNGYAMGALVGSDGAFVCGVMGGGTANAGRVYFPSGTPDLSDLTPDHRVDLASSVTRELEEETGLSPDLFAVSDEWIVVRRWPAVAFMRPIRCRLPAEAVAEAIRANIEAQAEPELADARVIRGAADIDPARMPLTVQSFLTWAFEGEGRGRL